MTYLLGLDVGQARVGTALCDESVLRAFPYKTFKKANYYAEKEIIKLIEEKQISAIVAGLPLDQKGQRTENCKKIENFCERLLRRTNCQIFYVDEYSTSHEAMEKLNLDCKKTQMRARKEGQIDAMAASIILQDYLDSKNR